MVGEVFAPGDFVWLGSPGDDAKGILALVVEVDHASYCLYLLMPDCGLIWYTQLYCTVTFKGPDAKRA